MTKTRTQRPDPRTGETADQAYARNLKTALNRLDLIRGVLEAEAATGRDWGDVGSLAEVVKNLGYAGHWAGVPSLIEE